MVTKIRFGDLVIGQEFFDPYSGDMYIKRFNDVAEWSTKNGDAWSGECDTFAADDIVVINFEIVGV
jgi:hypothetical protein